MKALFACPTTMEVPGKQTVRLMPSPTPGDFVINTQNRELPIEVYGDGSIFKPGHTYQLEITDVTNADTSAAEAPAESQAATPAPDAAPTAETEATATVVHEFTGKVTVTMSENPRTAVFTIVENEPVETETETGSSAPADQSTTTPAASQEANSDTQGNDTAAAGASNTGSEQNAGTGGEEAPGSTKNTPANTGDAPAANESNANGDNTNAGTSGVAGEAIPQPGAGTSTGNN